MSVREKKPREASQKKKQVKVKTIGVVNTVRHARLQPTLMANINGFLIMGCVVDGGSSTNALNEEVLANLKLPSDRLQSCSTIFVGPCSEKLHVVGRIEGVPLVVGGVCVLAPFTVLRLQKKGYPVLHGQPWLESVRSMHDWDAGTLTLGLPVHRVTIGLHPAGQLAGADKDMRVLQFGEASGDEEEECSTSSSSGGSDGESDVDDVGADNDDKGMVFCIRAVPEPVTQVSAKPATKWVEFPAGKGCTKRAQIALDLPTAMEEGMLALFSEYHHLFVTDHAELPQTNLGEHRIKLRADAKLVVHRTRRIRPKHMLAVKKELKSLLGTRLIYPVQYTD